MNFAPSNKFGRQTEIICLLCSDCLQLIQKYFCLFTDNSTKKVDTPEVCNGSVTDRQTDGRTDGHIIAPPNPLGLLSTL